VRHSLVKYVSKEIIDYNNIKVGLSIYLPFSYNTVVTYPTDATYRLNKDSFDIESGTLRRLNP
jgi:hypothetical protein